MYVLSGKNETKHSAFSYLIVRVIIIMLDAIPAWVCAQCGEVYFDEAEVETIHKIIRTVDDQTEKMAVSA